MDQTKTFASTIFLKSIKLIGRVIHKLAKSGRDPRILNEEDRKPTAPSKVETRINQCRKQSRGKSKNSETRSDVMTNSITSTTRLRSRIASTTLLESFQKLEEANPELITPDSPTQRVGGRPG